MIKRMEKLSGALVFAVVLPVCVAQADDAVAARSAMQQVTEQLLARLHTELKTYLEDEKRLYAMLEEVVLPTVDMPLLSRLVLGNHWKTASEFQKRHFVEKFQTMLIRSYGKTLLLLPDIRIEYEPLAPDEPSKKYQVVRTKVIASDNRAPLSISYSLINREGWKVFDIIIDGSSIARQFRNGFDQEIRETGFDALVARLSQFDY